MSATLETIGGLAIPFPANHARPNAAATFQRKLAAAIILACHDTLRKTTPPASAPQKAWCLHALDNFDAVLRSLLYLYIAERDAADTLPGIFLASDAAIKIFVNEFLEHPLLGNYVRP